VDNITDTTAHAREQARIKTQEILNGSRDDQVLSLVQQMAENSAAIKDTAYSKLQRDYMALLGRYERGQIEIESLRQRLADEHEADRAQEDIIESLQNRVIALEAIIAEDNKP
jgi:L-lactate utilization protein LutC